MSAKLKQKDILINDDAVAEVLEYIQQASPDNDNYIYAAKEHLDRLLFTASYIVKNFPVSTKILDIGSFPFFLPGYLSTQGFKNICTTDINRPDDFSLDTRWGVQSYKLDIEEEPLPCEDESLDLVLLLEVFEHLYRRPNHVFREIRRVLKPGGALIISTPNGGRIDTIIKYILRGDLGTPIYEFSSVYEKLGHFTHIREYTLSEIKKYLKHFSFSVEDVILSTFYTNDIPNPSRIRTVMVFLRKALWFLPMFRANIFLVARKSS